MTDIRVTVIPSSPAAIALVKLLREIELRAKAKADAA